MMQADIWVFQVIKALSSAVLYRKRACSISNSWSALQPNFSRNTARKEISIRTK